jgi:hypothetical protein
LSTQKHDSGYKVVETVTNDISTTSLIDTNVRTLTGVQGVGEADVWLYTSLDNVNWFITTTDQGDPYVLKFLPTSGNYIPLNPQFFYGIRYIKFVIKMGSLTNVSIIERMV